MGKTISMSRRILAFLLCAALALTFTPVIGAVPAKANDGKEVSKIEFTPADAEFYKLYIGNEECRYDYSGLHFMEGDELKVDYTDGTNNTYLYTDRGFCGVNGGGYLPSFVTDSEGSVDPNEITYKVNHPNDGSWKLGENEDAVIIYYGGKEFKQKVTLVNMNIEYIKYVPNTKDGTYEIDDIFLFADPENVDDVGETRILPIDGDKFIIKSDGKEKTYIFDEGQNVFKNEKDANDKIDNSNNTVYLSSGFYDINKYRSNNNKLDVKAYYHGIDCDVDATVNTVKGDMKNVADKIMNLPLVNDIRSTDEQAIKDARTAYDNLSDKKKFPYAYYDRLKHFETVLELAKEYDQLEILLAELSNTDNLTYKSKRILKKTESLATGLSFVWYGRFYADEERVNGILDSARNKIDTFENIVDQDEVAKVKGLIANLKENPTLEDEDAVKQTSEEYQYLTVASKAEITDTEKTKLQNAENKIAELKQEIMIPEFNELKQEADKLPKLEDITTENVTWKQHSQTEQLAQELLRVGSSLSDSAGIDYYSIYEEAQSIADKMHEKLLEKRKAIYNEFNSRINELEKTTDPKEYQQKFQAIINDYNAALESDESGYVTHYVMLSQKIKRIQAKAQEMSDTGDDPAPGSTDNKDKPGNDNTDNDAAKKAAEEAAKKAAAKKAAKAAKVKAAKAAKAKIKAKALKGKKVKLTWKKVKNVSGFEIYQAAKKKGKYKKVATIKKAKATKWTSKKLKKVKQGKKVFYKVRVFTKIDGKKIYGKWSNIAIAKIK